MERNIVTIRFDVTILDFQLKQVTIQKDHNIHTCSLFLLVALAVKNSRKLLSGLFLFSFLTKEQKRKTNKT